MLLQTLTAFGYQSGEKKSDRQGDKKRRCILNFLHFWVFLMFGFYNILSACSLDLHSPHYISVASESNLYETKLPRKFNHKNSNVWTFH